MTDYAIPCEVVARLSAVAFAAGGPTVPNEWFRSIRIDNGIAVVCNGPLMAVERLTTNNPSSAIHVPLTDELILQCATESKFKSSLHITVNEPLRFASAKTTLGWSLPGNAALWLTSENKLDGWRKVLPAKQPTVGRGGMFMNAEIVATLAASSPSGRIVFSEHIDRDVATVIRDIYDENWFGIWMPRNTAGGPDYEPAKLPGWVK